VTSDAHRGLVEAIGATLPGASWQRCRTHYAANLVGATPKASWPWAKTMRHSVHDQPDATLVHVQFDRLVDTAADKLPKVAGHLEAAPDRRPGLHLLPQGVWRRIWSSNPQERLNREIRCSTDVVGIFPDHTSLIRLVGAVLTEQHDEWTEERRYLGLDVLTRSRITLVPELATEVTPNPSRRSAPNQRRPRGSRRHTPRPRILPAKPAARAMPGCYRVAPLVVQFFAEGGSMRRVGSRGRGGLVGLTVLALAMISPAPTFGAPTVFGPQASAFAATCTRMPDRYMSCRCPDTYNVTVYWTAVKSTSYLWYGKSVSHMETRRIGGVLPFGENPVEVTGTGYKSRTIYTNGPVYYSPGSGKQGTASENMGAKCIVAS